VAVRRLLLVVMVVLGLSAGVLPAQAVECVIVDGTPPNQTYECEGSEGVNVGDGDDIVYVIGEVTNTIVSNGGTVTVYIVGPDGALNVLAGDGIYMSGDGNVTSAGDITADSDGIRIDGSGNVTSAGDITAGGDGIFIWFVGNVNSTGDISAGESGIVIGGSGDVSSTGNITANGDGIFVWYDGDVTSAGDINAGVYGIVIGGSGDVTSAGNISAGASGIYINGSGNVTSAGDISAGGWGISIVGDGNVSSAGNITAGGYGIYINGSGDVTSAGDISAYWYGIVIGGSGDVSSAGNITANGAGIFIWYDGNVTSVGNITAANGAGIYIVGGGNVTSAGDITADWDGIYIGGGNVNSTGDISAANGSGIFIWYDGDVKSEGNIDAGANGIYVGGNGVIDVLGSVHGDDVGIAGGEGEQVVLIEAVVSGGSGVAVSTGGGNDRVYLSGNAVVSGDIRMGSGDDVVQIASGARVSGVIDGGAENVEDVLIVGDAVYCRDLPGGLDTVLGHRALVAGLDAAEAAFVSEGERYEVRDFERAVSGLSLRQCVGRIDDGRINAYDLGAWVAGYCNVEEGVNLWAIGEDGHGQADVSVDGATMRAALEAAVSSGQNVEIARGPRGTSLWALASGEYQMMGPDARQPGESYVYVFAPGTCGMSNVLS